MCVLSSVSRVLGTDVGGGMGRIIGWSATVECDRSERGRKGHRYG